MKRFFLLVIILVLIFSFAVVVFASPIDTNIPEQNFFFDGTYYCLRTLQTTALTQPQKDFMTEWLTVSSAEKNIGLFYEIGNKEFTFVIFDNNITPTFGNINSSFPHKIYFSNFQKLSVRYLTFKTRSSVDNTLNFSSGVSTNAGNLTFSRILLLSGNEAWASDFSFPPLKSKLGQTTPDLSYNLLSDKIFKIDDDGGLDILNPPESSTPDEEIPPVVVDKTYVPYDTTIWLDFLAYIKGHMGTAVNVGFVIFGLIFGIYLIIRIVKSFTRGR